MELVEQRGVADDRPGIGEGQQELGVVDLESGALRRLTNVVPDRQAQIPEGVEKGVQEPFVFPTDDAGEEDQQVDVGVQAEFATAISAERKDRHRLREGPGVRVELLDQRVHAVRILPHGMTSALAPPGGVGQFAARSIEPRGAADAGIMARVGRGDVGFSGHRRQSDNSRTASPLRARRSYRNADAGGVQTNRTKANSTPYWHPRPRSAD